MFDRNTEIWPALLEMWLYRLAELCTNIANMAEKCREVEDGKGSQRSISTSCATSWGFDQIASTASERDGFVPMMRSSSSSCFSLPQNRLDPSCQLASCIPSPWNCCIKQRTTELAVWRWCPCNEKKHEKSRMTYVRHFKRSLPSFCHPLVI